MMPARSSGGRCGDNPLTKVGSLHERSVLDPRFGHVVNQDLAGYHIAANADVGSVEVHWLDEQDTYFNPIGAHPSARLGEDPRGVPNNLLPYVAQVAVGRRPSLRVWGRDYATPDGTGVRDYIHVMDLAQGHVAALAYLERRARSITANLGTGRGYSVLEVVSAFERASGKSIPLEFHPRRAGDVAQSYADASFAARELGWRARLGLEAMCRDAWRWQSGNPEGYPD